jgi:hypothetical protein
VKVSSTAVQAISFSDAEIVQQLLDALRSRSPFPPFPPLMVFTAVPDGHQPM